MTRYYPSIESLTLQNTWLAIGSFDGVHLGHRELLRQLVTGAHTAGCQAVAMTLYPHPGRVVKGLTTPIYLSTLEERLTMLAELELDVIVQLPFDRKIAAQSPASFMNRLNYHLGLKHLLVGQNFALGHDRKGSVDELARLGRSLGYQVTAIVPYTMEGIVISSSQIRAWLSEGDVELAARALGRAYSTCGQVIHGDERGGQIGIPTANLAIWQEQVLPAGGVYACWVKAGDIRHKAVANIGLRPTFHSEHPHVTVEAHLLDYSGNLYDQHLCFEFIQRIRGEQRYKNAGELVKQIEMDIYIARRLLV
ncbi:MAG: bifunctional riboflavin kinase/FAD synthetase [Anaerolineaceae bacterium]|nr:bifunctional riboflavin kinase/FAD synthetase [Anaerolineaceae bacterium]